MKESDYLNPNDIKSQCDQAIHKLENDNETLNICIWIDIILEEIISFRHKAAQSLSLIHI